jgi:predicted O-methyltransferase YrrM
MDAELKSLLADLYRRGREHDAEKADRLERWRNVEPDTAALLSVLVLSVQPRRLLEIGTSNGFSTIWLADAARAIGGSVVSVEIDPDRTEQARANLRAAGLDAHVELRTEDAAGTLARSADGEWDAIFLDAERPAYPGYWPELLRVLAAGGLLVVDNVLSHADQVAEFRELVTAEPTVSEAMAPTGAGALLVVKHGRRRLR